MYLLVRTGAEIISEQLLKFVAAVISRQICRGDVLLELMGYEYRPSAYHLVTMLERGFLLRLEFILDGATHRGVEALHGALLTAFIEEHGMSLERQAT